MERVAFNALSDADVCSHSALGATRSTSSWRRLAGLWLACGVLFFAARAAVPPDAPDLLRWRSYSAPEFPPELIGTVVREGFATVVFTFDDDGRITDRIVIAASHPGFSGAVLNAVRFWAIDTADLAPRLRRETLRFDFERRGAVVSLNQREASKTALSPSGDQVATALSTCPEHELDQPLRLEVSMAPEFPAELKAHDIEGTATIEFVVDGAGRLRVPAIVTATQPEFGAAAMAAMRQWRFALARRNGHIVQVFAERTVVFRLRAEAK